MFLQILIGLAALIVWEYFAKKRPNQVFKESGITGPSVLPLIGAAHHFVTESPLSMLKKYSWFCKIYGKTWRMWFAHEYGIVTADPRLMEALLSSQQLITKSRIYDLLETWLGNGLLMSTGKKWHSRRKAMTPTFHFKILEQFVEVFDQQSAVMAKKFSDRADGKTVINIFPVVCLCTLDIIAETAMGVKVNAQMDPNFPYVKSVTTVANITTARFMKFYQRFDTGMKLTAPFEFQKLQKHIKSMHEFTDRVIEERKSVLEKSIADGTYSTIPDANANDGTKKRMALLDVLLQSNVGGTPLTNNDIREEVDTFMFEGHDTTTSGTSYTLYLIARHPDVQAKIFREIREVIGDNKKKPITMRDLQDLKYLECVIKESLRLYPPVPLVGRRIMEDVNLNGTIIPGNSYIVAYIYEAHRDPDYFPNPEAFLPERFDANSADKINPFAYIPFSAGPRNCIGQKFAMLEMKAIISKMLRNYELLPLGDEVRPVMSLVLRPANGIYLGLKPRLYE